MADLSPSSTLHDLTVYLRHLKNADRMLATLKSWMDSRSRPVHVCWYGDHVPIMPHVYDAMKPTSGDTDYLLWSNRRNGDGHHGNVAIEALGPLLLTAAGLIAHGLLCPASSRRAPAPRRPASAVGFS